MLYDVYDEKVWKDFQSYGGRSFLFEQRIFQPYENIRYSLLRRNLCNNF